MGLDGVFRRLPGLAAAGLRGARIGEEQARQAEMEEQQAELRRRALEMQLEKWGQEKDQYDYDRSQRPVLEQRATELHDLNKRNARTQGAQGALNLYQDTQPKAPPPRAGTMIETGEGQQLIDPTTGEVMQSYGAKPRAPREPRSPTIVQGQDDQGRPTWFRWDEGAGGMVPVQGGAPLPRGTGAPNSQVASTIAAIEGVKRAQAALASAPDAVGARNFATKLPLIGGIVRHQRDAGDQSAVEARAALTEVSSALMHARSGGAISPEEFQRLVDAIPQDTDDPNTAQTKLAGIYRTLNERLSALGGSIGSGGDTRRQLPLTPPAGTAPAPGVDVNNERTKAHAAIRNGADPEKVRAVYRQRTGEDLP